MKKYSESVHETFAADELAEFLSTMDEFEMEVEVEDGEFTVTTARGTLVAAFSETPLTGVPGGWCSFNHFV
jgi:hypothetical protein